MTYLWDVTRSVQLKVTFASAVRLKKAKEENDEFFPMKFCNFFWKRGKNQQKSGKSFFFLIDFPLLSKNQDFLSI